MDQGERGPGETDTRGRVMKAALAEFALWGYKGTSMRRIAERAGVNEVTIFRNFGNKFELMRSAAQCAFLELSVPTPSEEYLRLPLRDSLGKFLHSYLKMSHDQTDIFTLGMSESFAHPEMAELFKNFAWQNRVNLAEYFHQMHIAGKLKDANFSVLAHIVLSSLYSLVMVRHRAPEKVSQDLTDEGVINGLINGIACAYGSSAEAGGGDGRDAHPPDG